MRMGSLHQNKLSVIYKGTMFQCVLILEWLSFTFAVFCLLEMSDLTSVFHTYTVIYTHLDVFHREL